MTVSVTILDTFKSKVNYQVADTDADIFDDGLSPALLAADWTVYDATADAAGYQTVTADVPVLATDNAITTVGTYYFKVDTDGGGVIEYSVVIAGATTFTALAALMDTAYTAAGTVVFDDDNNRFVFTSGTTGLASSVVVTPGTTGVDVFVQIATNNLPVTGFTYNPSVGGTVAVAFTNTLAAGASQGYAEVGVGGNKLGATATGLQNVAGLYQATVTIDGVGYPVDFAGSAAQTYTTLLTEINADLPGAYAALVNGNLRITSPTFGNASTVTVTDGPTTQGTADAAVAPATLGTFVTVLAAATYDFDVTIDGGALQTLSITTVGGETYAAIAALMSAVVVGGSVSYVDSAFRVTSTTTGPTSAATIAAGTFGSGGGDLFAALVAADTVVITFPAAVNGRGSIFASLTDFTAISSISGSGVGDANAYQVVDVAGNKVGASATGLSNVTSGYQEAVFVYQKLTTDYTGLANDATAYTATATIDGVARAISVVGSAAQTFADLIVEINADISTWATASLVQGRIRVTSLATGVTSTVSLADTGVNPLFASVVNFYLFAAPVGGTTPVYTFNVVFDNGVIQGYQDVNVGANKLPSSATSLVGVTTYTATITVDGVGHPISILGSDAPTYGALMTQIQADLAGTADVGLVGGNIRVQSRSTGAVSTVAITAGTLFAAPLSGFVAVLAAVPGVVIQVSVAGAAAQTYTTLLAEINTDLGVNGTAALIDGNLRITSANALPLSSAVNILTPGTLLTKGGPLTGCNGVQPPVGGTEDNSGAVYQVVSRRGNASFSYQEFATWNIGLNTGTLPGPLYGVKRNTTADSAMYVYTGGSTGEPLVIS